MMDKKKLTQFLLRARAKTYAGAGGKVEPTFPGSDQLEYKEGKWLYRDMYYAGNGIFSGLETVYHQERPVWTNCYFGNFKGMTEKEIDDVLRKALIRNWKTARTWTKTAWQDKKYTYVCTPDSSKASVDELAGREEIYKNGKQIYFLYYAGGFIG